MNWLYNILGTILGWFSSITGGKYALGLLLYALAFKILFLPFSIKQQKNQIAMAKLTPKIALIKAKYKGRYDRVTQQKMQQEVMELQQKEGYSPLSGCLPMLIQLPLIIFLYTVIRKPLSFIAKVSNETLLEVEKIINPATEITKASSIDQIGLISRINEFLAQPGNLLGADHLTEAGLNIDKIPDFTLFGVNLAATPSLTNFSILVLLPVLAAAFQWFTMWLTRKINGNAMQVQGDDAQAQMSLRIMDIVMPLMTLFIAFGFSGMLGLYWIYQSIISIIQMIILSRLMPIPKFTEEEIKAMRKAERDAEKAQKAVLKQQPKYRSLHYIDEDDYDELPELKNRTTMINGKSVDKNDVPEIKD